MLSTKVSEIMRSIDNMKVVHIDDCLKDIVKTFIEENTGEVVSKILAISDGSKLIGILSVGDVLKNAKGLMKTFSKEEIRKMSSLTMYGQREKIKKIENQIVTGCDLKVSDIMCERTMKLTPEDTISLAFDYLLESNLRVLPVYNSEKKAIGIIRDVDLLECITDFINN